MPLFISETELQAAGSDVVLVAERADAYIQDVLQQLETFKARADAAAITAEQRTSVVEQKFMAMSSRFKDMENERAQLESSLQRRSAELVQAQAQLHKHELETMKQDSERERVTCELHEMRKARRELLDVVEQKNSELNEKNTYIKAYLDKIVFLTDERSNLEGKLHEAEAELGRSQAVQARLAQEKELLEQHNAWLNEELSDKLETLLKERRNSSELEIELRAKLATAEQLCKDTGESLQRNKEQLKDVELRLNQTREDLKFTKENDELKENHLSLEVETATKLVDLYKQSSEEWSKKATDLEGVIKALEVHLNQVEEESKQHLEKEVEARKVAEKNALESKEKVEKIEKELESLKKAKEEESVFLLTDFSSKETNMSDPQLAIELHELHKERSLPMVPSGVSSTALAATLLRDGWSITKIYIKYQEAIDAWRHEKQERKHSQALLQRVLQEIEQRAEQILDERAEHARMVEAYTLMEEKLHSSVDEQNLLENQIRELKAELRKRERDLTGANQECKDLQCQVAALLKECADIKHRANREASQSEYVSRSHESMLSLTTSDAVVSDRLLTFKDIHEIVQQNSQLRAVVRSLSHQNEECEAELKEAFELELKKRTDDAAQKVSTILRKSEEQTQLISSLTGTVGMYKRLYEELMKSQSMPLKENRVITVAETHGDDVRSLAIKSEEDIEKVRKEASDRLSVLEGDLVKARQDASVARMERDRLIVEATYAREQLQTILKDSENQRKEMDAVLARNVEFSQIITDYQRRLRESGEHLLSVEEKCRRLSVEVSVLEREKELISNAEKRASQELSSLSDRVHRLQAKLDNIHTVEDVQESMRTAEKKKLEEEVNRMQKEWVEMKHELDSERAHSRHLSGERDMAVKQAMDRIESISKELADALSKVSMFETRALVAEARCTDLEAKMKKTEEKVLRISSKKEDGKDTKGTDFLSDAEVLSQLEQAREEIDRLKEELDASKSHSDQYKQLAQLNEEALLRFQDAHNCFKEEAEKTKEALHSEVSTLREKSTELEKSLSEKENELTSAEANKETLQNSIGKEIASLRASDSEKRALLEQAEERIKMLKSEVDKEHQLWRTAHSNYERQVLLQADTIRELTAASEYNENLRKEVSELRSKAEMATSELESLRVSWEMEKSALLSEHDSLNCKMKELEEQNRILFDRVEDKRIRLTEHTKLSGDSTTAEHVENDLQDVIRFLRRSKETSDVEISLLKQERARLQKQLESALNAAEEAQANLRREHENSRITLCSEEEFKSLQAQVREMTLLRESNSQLRMENKRNFEECQSLRGSLQMKQEEVESLQKLLREREVEQEALSKDIDMQKAEIGRWENRVSQLLQKYKSFDMEEYNHIKSELLSAQETVRLQQSDVDVARGEVARQQEIIHKLEQEISSKDARINELEKRIKEIELSSKAETRKHFLQYKRKMDASIKEKDDVIETLSKQLDELKAGTNKRNLGEPFRSEAQIRQEMSAQHEVALKENENLLKEKDTRIQTLERTLEKEREELKKEKTRRLKDQKIYYETVQKQDTEKQKLLEELSALKREKDNLSENPQAKKTGRKIIRPKMDTPVEPQLQTEVSESGMESALELPETEADIREDAKLGLEVKENVSTTSAIVVASATLVDEVIGVRKRSSSEAHNSAEEAPGQNNKIEIVPAHKKQKGLDLKPVACDSEVQQTVTDTLVIAEASKVGEMDLEIGAAGDASDIKDSIVSESSDVQHALEVETTVGTRVPVQMEVSASKRLRIVRSEALQPPSDSNQKDNGIFGNEEKSITEEKSISLAKERAEQSIGPSEDPPHIPEVSILSTSQNQPTLAAEEPDSRNSIEDIPDITDLQTQSQDTNVTSENEAAENVLDLNDTLDVATESAGTTLQSEASVELNESSLVVAVVDMGAVEPPLDGVDMEDGEIEPEEAEDSNLDSAHQHVAIDASHEDKTNDNVSADASDKDMQLNDEPASNKKPPANAELSISKDQGTSGLVMMDQKIEEKATEKPLARPVKKGTTINLSERARERSIGRRSGILPPSPRRSTRWNSKRTPGIQRGRDNTNDGENEGDEEKHTDTQPTGSPARKDQE